MRPVVALLVVASLFYCLPLFDRLDLWGRQDWDQFTYRFETPRVALLRDHVLPTWNPYSSGGTVLLAHPDSPVLSPWYGLVLALGAPLGLRVQVALFMALGAVGMALFLRRMGAGRSGCVVGGMVFMMSSHFALHIAEGHLEWPVLGLMPWVALCIQRMQAERRFVLAGALVLASALTFGAVHIPAVYLPFLSVWVLLEAIRARRWRPVLRWAALVAVAVSVSAVKLLPTVEFASAYPREQRWSGGWTPLTLLPAALADPRQDAYYKARRDEPLPDGHFAKTMDSARAAPYLRFMDSTRMEWKFHEYACYIGLVGIPLALFGGWRTARRFWPLYAAGGVALLAALGATSPLDLWAALQRLPLYEQFRVPSRFLAAVLFVLAFAAGFGMHAVLERIPERARRLRRFLAVALPALLYLELAALGWRLFGDVFVVPPRPLDSAASFVHRYGPREGPYLYPDVMDSNMMAALAAGVGTLDAYENLAVSTGQVRTAGDPGYRGEAFLHRGAGTVVVDEWTMSRVRLTVSASRADTVVLNQNHDRGWRVGRIADGRVRDAAATVRTAEGLIGHPVAPGTSQLVFHYLPASLPLGAGITALALAGTLLLLATRRGRVWLTPKG